MFIFFEERKGAIGQFGEEIRSESNIKTHTWVWKAAACFVPNIGAEGWRVLGERESGCQEFGFVNDNWLVVIVYFSIYI